MPEGRYAQQKRQKQERALERASSIPPHPGPRPEDGARGLEEWKRNAREWQLSSFRNFVQANGRLYDYYAPLHDRMCDKYEAALPNPQKDTFQRQSMRMYPRHTLKTTGGIELLAWAILKNPKIQMHYVRTTADLASNGIFELRNEALATPNIKDLWGDIAAELTLDNQYELSLGTNKDPTVRAVGITGAITGTHIHFVWFDDIVTDENYSSYKLSRNINSRMAQYKPILHPVYGARMLTGTYWPAHTYHDQVVEENARLEKRLREAIDKGDLNEAKFLRQKMWDIDIAGAHNPDGSLLFPTLLNEDFLRSAREDKETGIFYGGWYEMTPASENKKVFPKDNRSFFHGQFYAEPYPHIEVLNEAGEVLGEVPVDVYMTLDPTLTADSTSDSVGVTILGCDAEDDWWVFSSKGYQQLPSAMVDIIALQLRVFQPRKLGIEPGALSAEMVARIQQVIQAEELPTIIVDLDHLKGKNRRNKTKRIKESLEWRYNHRKIHLQAGPWCVELCDQMDNFGVSDHDDVIDSAAMHAGFAKPCKIEALGDLDESEDDEERPMLQDWGVMPWATARLASGAPSWLQETAQDNRARMCNMEQVLQAQDDKPTTQRVGGHAGMTSRRKS